MYICLIDVRMFFTKYVQLLLVGGLSWFFLVFFVVVVLSLLYLKKGNRVFKKSSLNLFIMENKNEGMSLWSKG